MSKLPSVAAVIGLIIGLGAVAVQSGWLPGSRSFIAAIPLLLLGWALGKFIRLG